VAAHAGVAVEAGHGARAVGEVAGDVGQVLIAVPGMTARSMMKA
jgi:hypothetical protein